MIKNCILLFLIFFLPEYGFLFGQRGDDNIVSGTGLYKPVADSSYLFSDSIREVSLRQVRSYVLNPDYAYARDPEYWKKKQTAQKPGAAFRFFTGPVFRWTLFIAVTILLLFGIYPLAKESNYSWFSRQTKRNNQTIIPASAVEEIDFEAEIRKSTERDDYRSAIRYMYLRLICTARQKAGIQIRDSSTNAEILRAFGKHPQGGEFRYLAYAYEYIFYGGFYPDAALFEMLRNKFDAFQKQLST